jgi:predicted transcriptional regulator
MRETKEKKSCKLSVVQKNLILQWILEGLSDQQIMKRAKEQNHFELTKQGVNYYRQSKAAGKKVERILERKTDSALRKGLAIRENRVNDLQFIRDKLMDELNTNGLWIDESKTILTQNYETTETKKTFNAPLIRELRGVLDDAAKEMGERKGTPAINNFLIGDDALAALKKTYNYDELPDPNVIDGEYTTNETE